METAALEKENKEKKACPYCGAGIPQSPYVQFVGSVGGVVGSLAGYTLSQNLLVALLCGLAGILAGIGLSKAVLWLRS